MGARGLRFVKTLMMKLGVAGSLVFTACPQPKCPSRTDDAPTVDEQHAGSDCHRAGERLRVLRCKEYREDWDTFCEDLIRENVPVCPVKLSRIASCAEVDSICR